MGHFILSGATIVRFGYLDGGRGGPLPDSAVEAGQLPTAHRDLPGLSRLAAEGPDGRGSQQAAYGAQRVIVTVFM
jgi:hypothetical protein